MKRPDYISYFNIEPDYKPFFTVIITTYNRADLITRALDSLISQTEKDWDAIISDDGSTDTTYCRIMPYLETNPQIVYLRHPHKGISPAKNAGLSAAKGNYVTFLDSDDEYLPLHLEYRKTVLLQNPEVSFIHGGAKIIGSQFVPDRFDHTKKVNLKGCVIGGTFVIERGTALRLNGFRDFTIGEDADLFERAKMANISILEVHEPTYIYHHETDDSVTRKMMTGL